MARRGALLANSLTSAVFVWLTLVSTSYAIYVETVLVDNAGSAADTTGYGAVAYEYRIGKYEITNAQYAGFLNAVDPNGLNAMSLYDSQMSSHVLGGLSFSPGNVAGDKYGVKSGRGENPVVFVSWYDAIRMANWMNNGQGNADTETGAYTLGALGADAVPVGGPGIARNAGARWYLPSENEWYKAAYHQPFDQGGDGDGYWTYPTVTNDPPFSAPPPGSAAPNSANVVNYYYDGFDPPGYNDGYATTGSIVFDSSQQYLTDVGAYGESSSYYGTFDQAGNAYEWNEEPFVNGINRELRGGSFAGAGGLDLQLLSAAHRNGLNAATHSSAGTGFRLATIVPEPAAVMLIACALVVLWGKQGVCSTGERVRS